MIFRIKKSHKLKPIRSRRRKALKATAHAGLQPAMDWLLAHADDPGIDDADTEDAPQTIQQSMAASSPSTNQQATAAGEDDETSADGTYLAR